jgi:hypothetical protein
MEIFEKLLKVIYDGLEITFTPNNVAAGDHFLIFSATKEIKVTFHTKNVPYWLEFDGDEPMLLENCPESFFRSIIKNAKK